MQKLFYPLVISSLLYLFPTVPVAATLVDLNQKQPANLIAGSDHPAIEFKELNRHGDARQTHIRVQQLYAGHEVWGAQAVIHTRVSMPTVKSLTLLHKTNAYTSNGVLYKNLAADLQNTPALVFTPAQAQKAYAAIAGSQSVSEPDTRLIIYVDENARARWAFQISYLLVASMPSHPVYIIDAESFAVYRHWDDVKTLSEVAAGGFGGNKKTGRYIYDSIGSDLPALTMQRDDAATECYIENTDLIVEDVQHNDAIESFKCAQKAVQHNEYWDDDRDAVNGAFSPANDAMYAGNIIKTMYQDWYHVPVLVKHDGTPMRLVMRLHDRVENAYWFMNQMTFGDGGPRFYPLVSLGVAAHEISHGFTEQHADLYYERQSGGLNESFSDMAAQAAEFFATQHNTWQIGAEIMKADASLRYLDEPTKDCDATDQPGITCSINNVKDYHLQTNVHYSSGVFNKFFYLLSTSKSWDTRRAFEVMLTANMNYWTANTNFIDAACGVLSAAKDLGYDTISIKGAALAVGINTENCV